jgi:hypothetical protein
VRIVDHRGATSGEATRLEVGTPLDVVVTGDVAPGRPRPWP